MKKLILIIGIFFLLTFGCITQITEADDTNINSAIEGQILQYNNSNELVNQFEIKDRESNNYFYFDENNILTVVG